MTPCDTLLAKLLNSHPSSTPGFESTPQDRRQKHEFDPEIASYWQGVQEAGWWTTYEVEPNGVNCKGAEQNSPELHDEQQGMVTEPLGQLLGDQPGGSSIAGSILSQNDRNCSRSQWLTKG